MTRSSLVGARILADGIWLDQHALMIEGDRIAAILPHDDIPTGTSIMSLAGGMLLPGFIDTQVNGGGGILFNDAPTMQGIRTIAAAHQRFGTTALLPTLISDDLDVVEKAIAAVDAAILAGVPGVVGIHIEGPFLNEGKRGIHDAGKFCTLDEGSIRLLSSLKHGKTLVTLAPELAPAGAINALVTNGVIVAAGHSLASYEGMQRAIAEGLSGVTHLFNAMTQLDSRAPGVVGAALDSDLVCGIIVDGQHVHPASLRSAYRARGSKGLMLVTDAMPTVGSTLDHFRLGHTDIMTHAGALRSAQGTLAGSNLDMATAVRNCMSMMHVDLPVASEMASGTPANFMGFSRIRGRLAPGFQADIIHLDAMYHVQASWIGGAKT